MAETVEVDKPLRRRATACGNAAQVVALLHHIVLTAGRVWRLWWIRVWWIRLWWVGLWWVVAAGNAKTLPDIDAAGIGDAVSLRQCADTHPKHAGDARECVASLH